MMQNNCVAASAKRKRPSEYMPIPWANSHHTTCIDIVDDDDDETGTTLRGEKWSGDLVLEPIIAADVEIQKHSAVVGSDRNDEDGVGQMNDEDAEDWEAELDDSIQDTNTMIKDWMTLCTQIKTHMKKYLKTMPLSQLNQYMILGNFATLCIRGVTQIKASQEIARQWHDGEGVVFACQV